MSVLFLPPSLLFSTTIIISPDMEKQSLCPVSMCHFLPVYLSVCQYLSISVWMPVYLSCLSLSVFSFSILLSLPYLIFLSSLITNTHAHTTHSRRFCAIRVDCFSVTWWWVWCWNWQIWKHINVLNQLTWACVSSNTACQQQKNHSLGNQCIILRHVCVNFISQRKQKRCFGSISV